jgi:hypothetical protein
MVKYYNRKKKSAPKHGPYLNQSYPYTVKKILAFFRRCTAALTLNKVHEGRRNRRNSSV